MICESVRLFVILEYDIGLDVSINTSKKFDEIADLLDKVGKDHSTHTPGHVRQV